MELSRYLKIYQSQNADETLLVYATARGAAVRVPRDLLDDARQGMLSPEEESALTRLGILVPNAAGETEELRTLFDRANSQNRPFSALVALNLDCNLACVYCYEDHFRGKNFMSLETAERLIAHIKDERLARGMDVSLDFYGGEALLSLDTLRHIAGEIGAAAAAWGRRFSFNLVTNATLLSRKVALELKGLGLNNVRFTLDGPPDVHDSQRPFLSGAASFQVILGNMEEVCDIVRVQLGGNYTRDNYRRFPELLDILLERGLTPDRLGMVMFTPVTPSAGEAGLQDFSMGCASPNEPWLVEATLFLRGEILRRGFDTPKPKISACMVEFQNDLVIGWDGSLYKCPAFMGWEEMRIGTLGERVGSYAASHNLDSWKNEECLECPYLPLCFGGCRFLTRLRSGAINGVDCRREYLDAALEGMIRQDLELRQVKRGG